MLDLIAKESFVYVNPRSNRKRTVKAGTKMWSPTPKYERERDHRAQVCHTYELMGQGVYVACDDIARLFTVTRGDAS